MKKALEAAVLVAALLLGAFVVRRSVARWELSRNPPQMNPALRPGPDVANPGDPYVQRPQGSVDGLPMVKLSKPPKSIHRPVAVPPPASATP
jgi:hypothetical protein